MKQGIRVSIEVDPAGDTDVFRVGAADDILRLLVDAHDAEYSVPELVDLTGASRSTVWRAVALLEELDVLEVRETPQRKYVSIDPAALQKDDPILAIDQAAFHEPVRAFLAAVRSGIAEHDEVDRLVGVVVFGSVARGTADRRSDVDCLVVVEGDRTVARRLVTDVVADLRERRFDGDRFEFEHYVETVESATRAGEKLSGMFEEGITIYEAEALDDVRRTVMRSE